MAHPVLVIYFLFILLPISLLFLFLRKPAAGAANKLPPGPSAWPIIGTQPRLPLQLHIEFYELAKTYGPLMRINFGVEPIVVGSDPLAAMGILKDQDRSLSGRFAPHSTRVKGYIENSMVWSDCDDNWKLVRKILKTELLTPKMLTAHAPVREAKVSDLLHFLKRNKEGQVVEFYPLMYAAVLNMLGGVIYSQDVCDYEDREADNDKLSLKCLIRQLMHIASAPNMADLYPILRRWDVQGLRKASRECVKHINRTWAGIVQDRRANKDHSKNDFLQMLIDSGFNDAQINTFLLEIFGPGSDTTTTALEWAMSQLMKNPSKMSKLQEEVDRVVGRNREVKDSDLPTLPYLHAVMKEALRLHPPVTFLLPHRAMETCEVMNYTIPKDTQVVVNMHAMSMDPTIWPDPLAFKPERFLNENSDVDYQGNHYHYIPFGSGRRICPGLSLASRVFRLLLVSVVHSFDWSLVNGMLPEELDMTERLDTALVKATPLLLIPRSRSP